MVSIVISGHGIPPMEETFPLGQIEPGFISLAADLMTPDSDLSDDVH